MSGDIFAFLNEERRLILEEKRRLGLIGDSEVEAVEATCDNEHQQNNNVQSASPDCGRTLLDKENVSPHHHGCEVATASSSSSSKILEDNNEIRARCNNIIPALELGSDAIRKSNAMLRYGEYSPNNPQVRVPQAAPYIGLGEYEQRRNFFLQKQRADYLAHLSQKNDDLKRVNESVAKYTQTDIQNIHSPLVVQHELESYNGNSGNGGGVGKLENDLSYRPTSSGRSIVDYRMQKRHYLSPSSSSPSAAYRLDQRLTSAQNALLKSDLMMDAKPKSILSNRRTGSPRERLMSDLKHSYAPSFLDGFTYADRGEELERERLKRENYQQELRLQIEEKRHLQALRDDQERREQELENRRLEQQLLRMREEQMVEEQRRNRRDEQMRRHSEDLLRRKHELQCRTSGSVGYHHPHHHHHRNTTTTSANVASPTANVKQMAHYSPPVARRTYTSMFVDSPISSRYPHAAGSSSSTGGGYHNRKDTLNRMDSLNSYNFGRFDSLSRIDSLGRHDGNALGRLESLSINDDGCYGGVSGSSSLGCVQRRHSATQQDLSAFRNSRSPKLQRRSSSGRFDDTLMPIPVLKMAHSPVAKDLKNSVPFNSGSSRHSSSDALRKLEDKWQIPAVQKNIINHHSDASRDGRSILTQLGAIRMQLQQEQLRMDETLRKRDLTQSKAVDFH